MSSIIKVDTIQDQSGNNIINENADTITIGASGDTITVPTGATLTVPNGGLSGQNYPAFEAYLSAGQTVSDSVTTKVQFDTEVYDTNGYYDNSANYRFTPLVAGKYFVYCSILGSAGTSNLNWIETYIYKNGSKIKEARYAFVGNPASIVNGPLSGVIDMNGSTDYLEIFGDVNTASGATGEFNEGRASDTKDTYFGAYRIGA